MSRRTARVHVLNLIFQIPFHPEWDESMLNENISLYIEYIPDLKEHISSKPPNSADCSFIIKEVTGIFTNLSEIDGLITKNLKDWELNRIAKIDLALLRLAVYEMVYEDDISTATSINESVELSKKYGADESPPFINGILGQAALQIEKVELHNG